MIFRKYVRYKSLGLLLLAVGLAAAGYALFLRPDQPTTPDGNVATQETQKKEESPQPESPKFPVIDLQPTVDAWAAKQSGQASVVIIDLANKKTVAELNSDTKYFAASLYKLYVAYEGYRKVADGSFDMGDSYLSGYARGKCLDAMIRESYSPCAEKMWVELGKESLTAKLATYGINDTSMTSISTTAHDAAAILQRLFERRELTEVHTKLYLDSLKTQPSLYRRGLPSGFAKSTVYNKVGWNGYVEWHDAAIVTLPSGRSYVVSVLTKDIGTQGIIELAKALEAKFL